MVVGAASPVTAPVGGMRRSHRYGHLPSPHRRRPCAGPAVRPCGLSRSLFPHRTDRRPGSWGMSVPTKYMMTENPRPPVLLFRSCSRLARRGRRLRRAGQPCSSRGVLRGDRGWMLSWPHCWRRCSRPRPSRRAALSRDWSADSASDAPSQPGRRNRTASPSSTAGWVPAGVERHGLEYKRHGTLTLYAVLNVQTGEVEGKTTARHTSLDFVSLLGEVGGHPARPTRRPT